MHFNTCGALALPMASYTFQDKNEQVDERLSYGIEFGKLKIKDNETDIKIVLPDNIEKIIKKIRV